MDEKKPGHLETNRTAIVTGAGSGLGRALALRLARDNWHIALADIDLESTKETQKLIDSLGTGSGEVFELDVSKMESWQKLKDELEKKWQTLDLLVNNAGITASGEIGVFPIKTWRKVIEINLWGAILGCQVFVGWLKKNPGSHILNISSIMGFLSGPTIAAYNISKAGLISLSETLYCELSRHGVGVSVGCPAFFATHLIAKGEFTTEREREYAKKETQTSRLTADGVADYIIKRVYKKKLYIMTPFVKARGLWFFKRMAPRIFIKLVAYIGNRRLDALEAKP